MTCVQSLPWSVFLSYFNRKVMVNFKSGQQMRKIFFQLVTQAVRKKTCEYSQQESNLWPTGYYCRCSTTELYETRSKLVGVKNTKLGSCDKCSTTVRSTRIFSSAPSVSLNENHLALPFLRYTVTLDKSFSSFNFCKETIVLQSMLTVWFYKINKIVRALWLAERSVCMRVCKHGCGVKLGCL